MATKRPGGKITGLLALGFESQVALQKRNPVHIVGDYQVALADGTKPVVGVVSVPNVKRLGREYPVANIGGDVTVEVRGLFVETITSGGAIAAGVEVSVGAAGIYVATGTAGSSPAVGIALEPATGAGQKIDVLFR